MNQLLISAILALTLSGTLSGCGEKNKQTQIYDLPGIETSISKIQISPLAYDRAIVTLKGIVAEINEPESGSNIKEIIITDPNQNTQKLTYDGDVSALKPGDLVVISGMFDKASRTIITDRIMVIPYKVEE